MDFLGIGGRRVLVTGASSGIGRAVAMEAADNGANLVLSGRRRDELEWTRDHVRGDGHIVLPFDLGDPRDAGGLVEAAAAALGGLDGIVHAAGEHELAPLRSVGVDSVARSLSLNVTVPLMLAQAFRHKKIAKADPSIVLISSVAGLVGQPGASGYSASKGGVISLTRSLALELAREQIRVNCICPGIVDTPMTESIRQSVGAEGFEAIARAHPLGIGSPSDVADTAVFLLSTRSKWITGSAIVVDGGYTAQ